MTTPIDTNTKLTNKNNTGKKTPATRSKGYDKPSDELLNSTINDVKSICGTNNKVFIVKNILSLINSGSNTSERDVREFIKLYEKHGKKLIHSVKEPIITKNLLNELSSPAETVGRSMIPLGVASIKNQVPEEDMKNFKDKHKQVATLLKELSDEAIDLLAKYNVKNLDSESLERKVNRKKELIKKNEIEKSKAKKIDNVKKDLHKPLTTEEETSK